MIIFFTMIMYKKEQLNRLVCAESQSVRVGIGMKQRLFFRGGFID